MSSPETRKPTRMPASDVRVGDEVQELLHGVKVWGTVTAVFRMPKTLELTVDFGLIAPARCWHRNGTLLNVVLTPAGVAALDEGGEG